ncbi:hypothetical protein ACXWRS_11060, partial [Streptococcus pyogenes]
PLFSPFLLLRLLRPPSFSLFSLLPAPFFLPFSSPSPLPFFFFFSLPFSSPPSFPPPSSFLSLSSFLSPLPSFPSSFPFSPLFP